MNQYFKDKTPLGNQHRKGTTIMTTPTAEKLYRVQHNLEMKHKKYALYNPHNKPIEQLPIIFGFNDGGSPGWYKAALLAEDGHYLGGHLCSHEDYMKNDLGILEGTRPDRHETFRKHYPNGYRMTFVPADDKYFALAYKKNQELATKKPAS